MSTNYYFVGKNKYEERRIYLHKLDGLAFVINDYMASQLNLSESQKEVFVAYTHEYINKISDVTPYDNGWIHIGQRACGWVALLQRQDELYRTIKEMKEWYKNNKDGYMIINEYNNELTWDELEQELLTWQGKERGKKDNDGYYWEYGDFS